MASLLSVIDDDLSAFFVADTGFCQSAVYTPQGGTAATISVIFSEPHEESAPESILFANTGPMVIARTSDLPSARRDDKIVTGGVSYYIVAVMPDGTGTTTLRLTRDALQYLAPTSLAEDYSGSGMEVPLTWTLNGTDGDLVEVWRVLASESDNLANGTRVASLPFGETDYTDTTPSPNTWTYRVRVVGTGDAGPWSNDVSVTTVSGTLYLLNGRALLQADDDLWYFVGLGTEGTFTTLRIEQFPTAHPGGDIRPDIIFDVAGQGYRFHLVNEDDVITRGNPTASDETGLASLELRSTDGNDYDLTMVEEDGVITHKTNQTANP